MTRLIGIKVRLSNKKYSFSLIELLVVIVVLSSILALSLPRFRTAFNNLKFDNFCQNLASRMRYLQERASVEQKIYRLNIDLNNKIVKIEVKKEDSEEYINTPGLLGRNITIPEGIDIKVDNFYVFFYPDGNIEGKDIEITGYQNKVTIYIKESIGRIDLAR